MLRFLRFLATTVSFSWDTGKDQNAKKAILSLYGCFCYFQLGALSFHVRSTTTLLQETTWR